MSAWLQTQAQALVQAQARTRRWLLRLSLAALLTPAALAAAPVGEADMRAVRSVIQSQLDAFAAADAERAFSYASKGIRAQFGDAPRFMAMVQTAYPMVVRPAGVSFFVPRQANGAVWQTVQLRDGEGRLWLATYQLARQAGAGWRINGCAVVPDSGKSST